MSWWGDGGREVVCHVTSHAGVLNIVKQLNKIVNFLSIYGEQSTVEQFVI